jgi:type IV pilus assembly protein PilM
MAGSKVVWGIDIGQCALKAVKLSYDSKQDRAVAVEFDYIEHAKILSQPDAEPDELIRTALEKFAERNRTEGIPVVIAVPGQAGLARFVKLPPVDPKKVADIVTFEAKQQIPFALTDVVWDYQKIGSADEEEDGPIELDVGIFAIRREAVRKHLAPFQDRGIDPYVVQLAPVALYNYSAFDIIYHQNAPPAAEGESAPAPSQDEDDGDTLVILDMGADKTDVVITDGDSIWLRNLPIGGNHFTRALTRDLKLTFAKAEHLKKNATKAPDPKKLYQAMRPVFNEFVAELQRSIGFFRSTHKSSVIKKVVGLGNGFLLPGLQKFLQQNLEFKVEKVSTFHGLIGDDVINDQTFKDNIMGFAVAYGLALQGLEQTPIQTNLLPEEIRTARLVKEKKPWSLVAAAILLLGFTSVFIGNYVNLKSVSAETFNAPMQQAQANARQYATMKTEFETAKTSYASVNDQAKRAIGANRYKDRDLWLRGMNIVSKALPKRTDEEVRDVSTLKEVNIEAVRAVYFPTLSEWFGKIDQQKTISMAPSDRQAPPSAPGWVFQIRGYTFNNGVRLFVQDEILKNLQSPEMKNLGVSHAYIEDLKTIQNWTPSSTSAPVSMRDILPKGKGAGGRGDLSLSGSSTYVPPKKTGISNPSDKNPDKLPEDVRGYLKESLEENKKSGSQSKIERTDFTIEFAWNPDFVPTPPAGAAGMPGADPNAAGIPGAIPPGAPGAPPAPGLPAVPGAPPIPGAAAPQVFPE